MMSKILMTLTVALFAVASTGCCLMRQNDCQAPPAMYAPAPAPACGCGPTGMPATTMPGTISYGP
jgi:hypothetical protein